MENTNDEVLTKHKKTNRRLMIFYEMFSYDLLFYYSISYLFLVNVKLLTPSQVIFGEAFYPLFKIIFIIPCTFLIQKLGKKKSIIIADCSLIIFILIVLNLVNTLTLIIANVFCAFAYVIKGMTDANLLYDSIDEAENRRELFSKYEGKANASFYFFDAITALSTGFLFAINPYLPLIMSLFAIVISTLISFRLKEIKPVKKRDKNMTLKDDIKNYFSDVKIALKFITRSSRLKALIIFNATIISILFCIVELRNGVLNELGVPSEVFGVIFSIMGIISCYSASRAIKLHQKHRNRTLTVISIALAVSIIVAGLVATLGFSPFLQLYLILIMFSIQFFCKGSVYPIIKLYLSSFSDSKMRLKIYSVNALIESIITFIFSIIWSFILRTHEPSQTFLYVGITSLILIVLVLIYMLPRIGLKPDEYPEKDIDYSDLL